MKSILPLPFQRVNEPGGWARWIMVSEIYSFNDTPIDKKYIKY